MGEHGLVTVEFGREVPPRSFDTLLYGPDRDHRTRIDPLRHRDIPRTVCGIADQVAFWLAHLDTVDDTDDTVDAVLGYCAGSGFAAELAARNGTVDSLLILFDPVLPTMADAQRILTELAVGMDDALDPATVPDLAAVPTSDAISVVGGFLREVVHRSGPDIPSDLVDTLTEQQRIWISYTLAAVAFGAGARPPDHVFLSADAEWSAGQNTTVHRFGTDPIGLFHSVEVADVLAKILGR